MVGTTDHNLLVGVSAPRGNLYASIMDPRSTSSAGRTRALPASIILAKGAECREQTHSSVCGEEFSLDIPFYRTRPLNSPPRLHPRRPNCVPFSWRPSAARKFEEQSHAVLIRGLSNLPDLA